MERQVNGKVNPVKKDYSIDLKVLWSIFMHYWHWIIVTMVVCVFIAFVYLWVAPSTVDVTCKIKLIENKSNSGNSASLGAAMLKSLPMGLGTNLGSSLSMGGGGSSNIETEKEILQSNTLTRQVVQDLKLHTEYRLKNWGRKTLLYHNNPVNVNLDTPHLLWLDEELPLTYHQIDLEISKGPNGFTVEICLKENKNKTYLPEQTFSSLPATIKTEVGTLTLSENNLPAKYAKGYENGYTIHVSIIPTSIAASAFVGRMVVEAGSKKVLDVIQLSMADENVCRGIDFLTRLIELYNKQANDEKNEKARKTDEFVSKRLVMLDSELGLSDAAWESSKEHHQITVLEVDAEEVMTKKSLYEIQLVEIGTHLQLHDYLEEYVNNPANLFEIIPSGITQTSSSSSRSTTSTSSSSSTTSSSSGSASAAPGASAGTMSLFTQHNSLVNQRNDYLKSMSEKSPQVKRVTATIRELHPTIVTAMKRDRQQLVMQQNAIQREYSKYMGRVSSTPKMERELTDIARLREIKQGVYLSMLQKREETAMELANTTDKGKFIDEPVVVNNSAKPKKILVFCGALLIGFLLPLCLLYLYLIIKPKVYSQIDLSKNAQKLLIGNIPQAYTEDTIRNLRANLMLNLSEGENVIMVTSDSRGDGKSFVAQKLSDSLKVIGKKVELIKADLDSDVLASDGFRKQIESAKSASDYVIIDGVPMGDNSDAYMIAQYADTTLFVVKAGVTKKSVVENIEKDYHLPHVMLILNGIDIKTKIR